MTMPNSVCNFPGGGPATQACPTELQLNKGNHFKLRAARDMLLSAVRGTAWVTVDNEASETVVRSGDAFVIASGKTALVGPLHGSVTLELGLAPNEPAHAANWSVLERLRRLARGFGFGMA